MCFSFHRVARVSCPLVNCTMGQLVHWTIGPLDHWSVGLLVYWLNVKCKISNVICQMSNVKNEMSNVNKVKLLSKRTSGVPPVIFKLHVTMFWGLEILCRKGNNFATKILPYKTEWIYVWCIGCLEWCTWYLGWWWRCWKIWAMMLNSEYFLISWHSKPHWLRGNRCATIISGNLNPSLSNIGNSKLYAFDNRQTTSTMGNYPI